MDNAYDIAIIGMAGRFPGAGDLAEFWQNLIGGVESIARLTDQQLTAAGVPQEVLSRKDYVKAAPLLGDPSLFDAAFFGFSPGEAAAMDPQHRVLLELAHTALEDAGCDPARYRGRIGVFAGSAMNTYFMNSGLNSRFAEDYIPTLIVNDKDFLATRISYKLGLRGPSLTIQTACSTSLVAIHLARQSLLSEETDVALVGAVSVRVPHQAGYFYDGGGVVSPDGHVRAFDAEANGTVFGSGAGVIVLKRLADALAQGDPIHAVIKGSAVNNDGATKAGYTAPSVNGQADVIVEALANAGVNADSISYVEAHGSGTPVGDPIEILALTKAFRNFTQRNGYATIGSVKSNLGHLDAAAGMAGMIKTVLALKHECIPPTLHFTRPNPEIDFPNTPFHVNTTVSKWGRSAEPRRAGVMSTGMGGTNAHVVLEEAPVAGPSVDSAGPHLLVMSARSPAALEKMARNLTSYLETSPATSLANVAHTLQTGRKSYSFRRSLVCHGVPDAIAALGQAFDSKKAPAGLERDAPPPTVVFLLPGIGDHYVGMGHDLYEKFPVFRDAVDRCAMGLLPLLGVDVREILYPRDRPLKDPAKPKGIDFKRMMGRGTDEPLDPATQKLDQTIHCQPALFTVEYSLAQLWLHWGVNPERIVGHSMGEYVAACLAGVFSLEDALKLIATRAKLVNELPQGAMLAVLLPEADLIPLLTEELSISLINGPALCVVAGPVASMTRFQARLQERDITCRPVKNAHAFHSRLLDPIIGPFTQEIRKVRLNAPAIPFISNVTGTWITPAQATDPSYWAEHARRTARFNDALENLWKISNVLPLEVGPGRTLGVLAMQHPARPKTPVMIASSMRQDYENQPDADFLLNQVGRLWVAGANLNWEQLDERPNRRKVSLPTYPFERQSFWIEPQRGKSAVETIEDTTVRKSAVTDWFYVPTWLRTVFNSNSTGGGGAKQAAWLILEDESEYAAELCSTLERNGAVALVARLGPASAAGQEKAMQIRSGSFEDYVSLIGALDISAAPVLNIVHLGSLSRRIKQVGERTESLSQELGFDSLLNLAKAIAEQNISIPVNLGVITRQIHEVTGEEILNPSMATVLGACGVIPQEFPNITCFSIDLPAPSSAEKPSVTWAARLLAEFEHPTRGGVIAYRGKHRWERSFTAQKLPAVSVKEGDAAIAARGLRARGVYLITGGTGGIGLAVAKHLARTCQARLILVKKTPFPAKTVWNQHPLPADLTESDQQIVRELLEIQRAGGQVEVVACEADDLTGMRRVVSDAVARHGTIHGVIHAAGIVRAGLIQAKSKENINAVMAPKVSGTLVLQEALRGHDVDFLVLFSSITSVITPYAEADYSAANAFLDAYAHYANTGQGPRTLAINWPGWRETGQLIKLKSLAGTEAWKEEALQKAILTKDGVDAFERALASNLTQVIVSPEDLNRLVASSRLPVDLSHYLSAKSGPNAEVAPLRRAAGPVLQPRSELEGIIAGAWKLVLGVTEIGVEESFFDLGGHSLLLIRVHKELQKALNRDLSIISLFQYPTIAALAAHLGANKAGATVDSAQERVARFKQSLSKQRSGSRQ